MQNNLFDTSILEKYKDFSFVVFIIITLEYITQIKLMT